jgi:hypothetical protein
MPSSVLETIRDLVRQGRYDVTDHAWDEMADDNLLLLDVETAILTGVIVREDKGDPRGTVYVIEGVGADRATPVGAAVRFNERQDALVITVYKII